MVNTYSLKNCCFVTVTAKEVAYLDAHIPIEIQQVRLQNIIPSYWMFSQNYTMRFREFICELAAAILDLLVFRKRTKCSTYTLLST